MTEKAADLYLGEDAAEVAPVYAGDAAELVTRPVHIRLATGHEQTRCHDQKPLPTAENLRLYNSSISNVVHVPPILLIAEYHEAHGIVPWRGSR